jgi:hypothetical protein
VATAVDPGENESMRHDDLQGSGGALARLVEEVGQRMLSLPGSDRGGYVGSELSTVNRALARIQAAGLAQGPLFCEWGSGLGGVCGVAALNGFSPHGIEIQGELVDSARSLAKDLALPMVFAEGTFLLPGDEDLAVSAVRTRRVFDCGAWEELGLAPEECNLVFAYPWPSEEFFVEGVFARHASPGTLLLTFHDWDHLLVQRKCADSGKLLPLGWM